MFDKFKKEKSDFLSKKDKSKKGSIDKDAVKIVNEINSKNGYYTTSSCAGRIVLLEMKSKKKNECNWIFTKHDKVKYNEVSKSLKKYKQKNKNQKHQIWFKQQPLILHVACRDLDAAKNLLDAARKVFKHSGVIGITDKKLMVEIIGSERIETVIADNKFVVDEDYLKNLIKYANENFEENKKKSEKFLNLIKKL